VEYLAVLELEVPNQRNGVREPIGLITGAENRLHGGKLLAPEIGLDPAMLQALPQNRPLATLSERAVKFKVLDFIASQDRLDHSTVALGHYVAKREQLFVVGQSARHRFAVLAHVTLVAIRGDSQRATLHRFEDESAHLLHFSSSRFALHRLFA